MKTVKGIYNEAKVFTDVVDDTCVEQIRGLLDLEVFREAKVRIMPDCHAGASCVIGFTADLGDKVIPNIVGVDIGCGTLTVKLGNIEVDFDKLDEIIRKKVPYGRNVNEGRLMRFSKIQEMYCYRSLKDTKNCERAIGSLGGGNHFIEIDVDEDDCKYLIIHTGSRMLGKQVAEHYQKVARGLHTGWGSVWDEEEKIKKEYKETGRRAEIQEALKELHRNFHQTPSDMPLEYCFLSGKYTEQYLHDMKICQEYADENRKMIAYQILETYGLETEEEFTTVHNYIDQDSNIIRKDADGNEIRRELQQDSTGVREFFAWAVQIFRVVYENRVVFADEMDRVLNPILSDRVVAFVNGAEHRGQFVFSTHNVLHLNLKTYMKEQIYFVTKSKDSLTSELYSLADFPDVRYETAKVYEFYMKGILGGTAFE